MAAKWLENAVFYEIYPQSFYDSNGDGIGDIPGIIQKLDYVKSLGCNAIWLNPCFDSPFKDAGYDVRDYKLVAPRYGTNRDLVSLFKKAHSMGMKVLLDLVPGHTSEEHPWFRASGSDQINAYTSRYIWTDHPYARGDGMPFIGGEMPRPATYIVNFFKCQPALNYGYREIREPWQQSMDAVGPMETRDAIKDVMRYWLQRGCDGFRVDMADSLVKNDGEDKLGTMEVWRDLAGMVHEEYPEAVLVAEWGNPEQSLSCGFDMDFTLDWDCHGYAKLMRNYRVDQKTHEILSNDSYFAADSGKDITEFLADYLPGYEATKDKGLWCMITGNHDTIRAEFGLTEIERKLAFAFILTMPGAPFIYYGDEIGMRYQLLSSKEGGYHRTGSRTPMQWDVSKNLGFSREDHENLYLPIDHSEDAPTVAEQEEDPDSLLNFVRSLIYLRQNHPDLGNYSSFEVCHAEKGSRMFAYKRGKMIVCVNPGQEEAQLKVEGSYRRIYTFGYAEGMGDTLHMGPQSFTVIEPV